MSLNKDGIDTSKPVDFETLMRMKRKHKEAQKDAAENKPKRGRKKQVRNDSDAGVQGSPHPEPQEEA